MDTSLLVILLIALSIVTVTLAAMLVARSSAKRQQLDEERFKMLANDIFAQNSRQMRDENDRRIGEILAPLRDNLNEFRRAFAESYSKESRERYSLQEHLRQLIQLNDTIGREARELTSALKGNNRVQGQWGEMILQSILEKSGLRQGEEYFLQESTNNDDGNRLRPDAIISFPDGRKLVIDSKASLKAYLDLCETVDEDRQKSLAKLHVASLKNHINELKDKNYQDFIDGNAADFVMMFVPNEGAYLAAMQYDNSLWQYAYDNRVIIVSPTHLMSAIKLIEQTWRHDKQNRNAMEIAIEGGKLIDKLSAFLADMDKVNAALASAQKAYDSAMTKLNGRGGIISRAEKMQALGAKSSKSLPQTEN